MPTHDIDFLKQQWNSIKPSMGAARTLADINVKGLDRARTLTGKVARQYLMTAIFGLLLPPLILLLALEVPVSLLLIICYSTFGIFCSVINFYVYRRIKSSDYVTLPIVEAAECIAVTTRLIGRVRIVSTILMVPVLVMFFMEMAAVGDIYVLYGGIAGIVIGTIIAVIQWRRINHRLRLLREIFDQSNANSPSEDGVSDANRI